VAHEGLVTKATGTNEVHDKGVAVKEGVFRAQYVVRCSVLQSVAECCSVLQ